MPDRLAGRGACGSLELGAELPGGLLACVRRGRRERRPEAVLKLADPGLDGRRGRVPARWGGGPAPELLEPTTELGAILIERITPGDTRDQCEAATSHCVALAALHVPTTRARRPSSDGRPAGSRRARRPLVGEAARLGADGVQRLEAKRARLRCSSTATSTSATSSAAHGAGSARSIPSPCAGDALYDAAYWMHAHRRREDAAAFNAMADALGLDARADCATGAASSQCTAEQAVQDSGRERPLAPLQRPGRAGSTCSPLPRTTSRRRRDTDRCWRQPAPGRRPCSSSAPVEGTTPRTSVGITPARCPTSRRRC